MIRLYPCVCVCVCVCIWLFSTIGYYIILNNVPYAIQWGLPNGSVGKESTSTAGDTGETGSIRGLGRPLEEEMAIHSSILAQEIPWPEEPGRLYIVHGTTKSDTTEHLVRAINLCGLSTWSISVNTILPVYPYPIPSSLLVTKSVCSIICL